jgi:hypothetical protein
MEQHSNGAFGTAQNLSDLGGGHFVDETQDHRPPPIFRQPGHGLPGGVAGLSSGGRLEDVIAGGQTVGLVQRSHGPPAVSSAFVGDDVSGDAK